MDYLHWFTDLPRELATLLLAMLPVTELRAALPLAYFSFNLSIFEAFFWSVVGNMIPVFFLLWLFPPLSKWFRERVKWIDRLLTWIFERTRRKHDKKFMRWGSLALIVVVAIPLPGTGAWTGSLAAFLFGIPYKKALGLIFLGVLLAGVIVSAITLGVFKFV